MTDKEFLDIQQEKEYQNKLMAALLAMREYEKCTEDVIKTQTKNSITVQGIATEAVMWAGELY